MKTALFSSRVSASKSPASARTIPCRATPRNEPMNPAPILEPSLRGASEFPVVRAVLVMAFPFASHLGPVCRQADASAVTLTTQMRGVSRCTRRCRLAVCPAGGARLSVADRTGKSARTRRLAELAMAPQRAARVPGSSRRGLAGVLGGWSARHRMIAIGMWLLFVVAATVLGGAAGRVGLPDYRQGAGDSARAEQTLASAHIARPATELVLVRSSSASVTVASPAFRHAVGRALAAISGTGLARQVQDPYAGHLISANGRDALIRFQLRGADSTVNTVLAAVGRAQAASPGFTMTETGDASAQQALNSNISTNFSHAEWTAVPLAIGVLLAVFGALMAT